MLNKHLKNDYYNSKEMNTLACFNFQFWHCLKESYLVKGHNVLRWVEGDMEKESEFSEFLCCR